jgi:hypothetical protein
MRKYTPLIAAMATAAFLVTGCGRSSNKTATTTAPPTRAPAKAASLADLKSLANGAGHAVFWAGRKRGYTYELTQTSDGSIYIRYLPPGVPVGAAGGDFLSIGSYPQSNAFATVTAAQKQSGEIITKLSGGGVAVSNPNRPQSVYFAYPGSKVLVEVYDPSPSHAKQLMTSGKVLPIR